MLVVDPGHWLEAEGSLPETDLRLRRQALRVVQLVEAGGPLPRLHGRETLVPCTMRPNRRPCLGLMWVVKNPDDSIYAYCPACGRDEVVIHDWQDTLWADGPMEPVPFEPSPPDAH